MDGKHTPGPWRIELYENFIVSGTISIATTCHNPDRETTKANARLIAAAPDLLEALQVMLEHAYEEDWDMGQNGNYCIDVATAAIAKATRGE